MKAPNWIFVHKNVNEWSEPKMYETHFFLKVHLRRLNPYIWRHIFADPMSMISSIVMDWTKVFEGTFLQTACLGIIFSIDMDWTKLFEGTSMRTPWTPILPCSGLQVTNCFFLQILFCFILHVAASLYYEFRSPMSY